MTLPFILESLAFSHDRVELFAQGRDELLVLRQLISCLPQHRTKLCILVDDVRH